MRLKIIILWTIFIQTGFSQEEHPFPEEYVRQTITVATACKKSSFLQEGFEKPDMNDIFTKAVTFLTQNNWQITTDSNCPLNGTLDESSTQNYFDFFLASQKDNLSQKIRESISQRLNKQTECQETLYRTLFDYHGTGNDTENFSMMGEGNHQMMTDGETTWIMIDLFYVYFNISPRFKKFLVLGKKQRKFSFYARVIKLRTSIQEMNQNALMMRDFYDDIKRRDPQSFK